MLLVLEVFAGFGLFFVGVRNISSNLKQLSGKWFRRLIEKATRNVVSSSCIGLLSGAITQSSNAITFISISMVTAGFIDVSRVMPILIWANVGTSALVFLSAIDLNLFVFFLLGLIGIAYYFEIDKSPSYRHILGALFGLGLLFMGLELIKTGSAPLKTSPLVQEVLALSASSYMLDFLIGLVLTLVVQSSATVSIIAVTLINVGLLNLDETIILILGSSLGSGLSIALLSLNLSGLGRQIAYFQILNKTVGVVFATIFLILEMKFSISGIILFIKTLSSNPSIQVALFYCILQIISAIIVMIIRFPFEKLLSKLSPPTVEETLSKTHYIYQGALGDPFSALPLVEKEQLRIFNYIIQLVGTVRSEDKGSISAQTLSSAALSISDQCEAFLRELIDLGGSKFSIEGSIVLQNRQQLLQSLIVTVDEYVQVVSKAQQRQIGEKLCNLLFALGESFDTILCLAQDAFKSRSVEEISLLLDFTSDRSGQMENIRKNIMNVEEINPRDHQTLYTSTTLFERSLWLIRKYALDITAQNNSL